MRDWLSQREADARTCSACGAPIAPRLRGFRQSLKGCEEHLEAWDKSEERGAVVLALFQTGTSVSGFAEAFEAWAKKIRDGAATEESGRKQTSRAALESLASSVGWAADERVTRTLMGTSPMFEASSFSTNSDSVMFSENLEDPLQSVLTKLRELRDKPELRFLQREFCPRGQLFELPWVHRDEHGQAYLEVLIHPDDVPAVREAFRPELPSILWTFPKGLELHKAKYPEQEDT